jgi:hypothetical protein
MAVRLLLKFFLKPSPHPFPTFDFHFQFQLA